MVRELFIWCYLILFKVINILFCFCSVQDKITFVISFEENAQYVYRELIRQKASVKIVFLCKSPISDPFQQELSGVTVIPFEIKKLFNWIISIYHLSTSRFIIIDNYYGFLAAFHFKKNVECIQMWHAAGGLKTFGLQDKSVKYRSKRAHQRFRKIYSHFHKVVVGSEEMANIFKNAFGITSNHILRTGIPRTDFFYDMNAKERSTLEFYKKYPGTKNRKVILYAPTYRDGSLICDTIQLNIDQMYEELNRDYILLIKTHPAVKSKNNYEELYPEFVYDLSSNRNINNLLIMVDYLITDYSSIPFEYALLSKPMIFFPYDFKKYEEERGLIQDYTHIVPGPILYETNQIITAILEDRFNSEEIGEFSNKWNLYSDGYSSQRLVKYLFNQMKQ